MCQYANGLTHVYGTSRPLFRRLAQVYALELGKSPALS
jgi:hypothetical protein